MTHAKTGSWLWVQEPKGRWRQILKGPSIRSSFTDEDLLDCHVIACQGLLSPDLLPTVRVLLPSGQQMTQLQNPSLRVYYLGPNLVPADLDWILQKQKLRHVEVIYQKIFLGKTDKEVGICDHGRKGAAKEGVLSNKVDNWFSFPGDLRKQYRSQAKVSCQGQGGWNIILPQSVNVQEHT